MIVLGVTGSIGMGKSTAVSLFEELGYSTLSSDEVVHTLMDTNGKAIPFIRNSFPECLSQDENGHTIVNRKKLGQLVFQDDSKLKELESILHPMVIDAQMAFLTTCLKKQESMALLDIPLLYETQGETRCDAVLVVTAPDEEQKKRVMARPGMNEDRYHSIMARQIPNDEKIKRADFILEMTGGHDLAREKIQNLLPRLLTIEPTFYRSLTTDTTET
jgi:dephospho-CoA kinase